jgi:hypothetical protein
MAPITSGQLEPALYSAELGSISCCVRLSLLGAFNLLMPIGPDVTAFIFVDESSQILTSSWLSVGLKVFILPHCLDYCWD